MQVDPIKPTLKPPGTKRFKLKYDVPLSFFAFKCNSCRYNQVAMTKARTEFDSQNARYGPNLRSFPGYLKWRSTVRKFATLSK